MDGKITVESQTGEGSTFRLTLRLLRGARIKDSSIIEPIHAGRSAAILIENEVERRALAEMLTSRKITIVPVTLEDLAQGRVKTDFILTDWGSPSGALLETSGAAILWLVSRKQLAEISQAHGSERALLLPRPVRRSSLDEALQQIGMSRPKGSANAGVDEQSPEPFFVSYPTRPEILLVEDNPTNQRLVHKMLSRLGCVVVVAAHGREALDLLATREFDLLLLDHRMPVLDGIATATAVREEPRLHRLPIVAMMSNASEEDRAQCLAVGMDACLDKPLTMKDLASAIRRWMGSESEAMGRRESHCAWVGLSANPFLVAPMDIEGFRFDREVGQPYASRRPSAAGLEASWRTGGAAAVAAQSRGVCRRACVPHTPTSSSRSESASRKTPRICAQGDPLPAPRNACETRRPARRRTGSARECSSPRVCSRARCARWARAPSRRLARESRR